MKYVVLQGRNDQVAVSSLALKFRKNQFTFKGKNAIKSSKAVTKEWGFPLTYEWQ